MMTLRPLKTLSTIIAVLAILPILQGCVTTTRTSLERTVNVALCEQAKSYWYKPSREEYESWSQRQKDFHKKNLDAYRREMCPEILGD